MPVVPIVIRKQLHSWQWYTGVDKAAQHKSDAMGASSGVEALHPAAVASVWPPNHWQHSFSPYYIPCMVAPDMCGFAALPAVG